MKTIGFIGCGKMAKAMVEGMLRSGVVTKDQVMASAATERTLQQVQEQYGLKVSSDNQEVAKFSNVLFLAIKPTQHQQVIQEIKQVIHKDTIIVTIAAGISLAYLTEAFGFPVKAVRTMPNTPSLVGQGMSAICPNDQVTHEELERVLQLFKSFGKAEVLEETLMDAIPAISGSSPAYVYLFIEALADGGVQQGIPREQAYKLAAQSVLGGATIEAVASLEKTGFRASVLTAMERCTRKIVGLAQKKE